MPVSYIPSGGNPLQEANIDPGQLAQIGIAVKQTKLAESQQDYEHSIAALKMLSENPQLMETVDPKMVEKHLKNVGLDPASAKQGQALQGLVESGGAAQPASTPIPTNQLEQLGKTMQGSKAGAQSATPPSDKAAAKAPGGGVTPGGIVTPGTGQLQDLEKGAVDAFTKQVGALAPLYKGAASQREQQFLIAQKQQEIHNLMIDANSGSPTSVRSFAMLNMLNGHNTTADDMRAILSGNKDEKVATQAMDYALGNETGDSKMKRLTDTAKNLMSSPDFMGKLKNPLDVQRVAQSIIDGHGVPDDLLTRPYSLNDIMHMNTYEKQLTDLGMDLESAHHAAEANVLGIPYTLSLPPAMHGVTIPQQDSASKATTATGMYMRGEGAMMEGEAALQRVHEELDKKLPDALKEKLEKYIMLEKNGVSVPQPMKDELLSEAAAQSGIDIKRVSSWYDWLWLGSHLEATGTADKGALEGQGSTATPGITTQSPIDRASQYGTASDKDINYVKQMRAARPKNQPYQAPRKEDKPADIPIDTTYTQR